MKRPKPAAANWSNMGAMAADRGEYEVAKSYFEKAVEENTKQPLHRLHLAMVLEALGEFGPSAEQLTEALRLNPMLIDAARILGSLAARRVLPANVKLNVHGLKAALKFERINRDQIAEVAIYAMARVNPLLEALEIGRSQGWSVAARGLCLQRTSPLMMDEIFCTALSQNIIRMPELEKLLTALRQVLLIEIPDSRFEDRALLSFVITLAQHCWLNEYVWDVSEKESLVLKTKLARPDLFTDDISAGIDLALAATFGPIGQHLGKVVDEADLKRVKPNIVRDFLLQNEVMRRDEAARATRFRSLASSSDATSHAVASQYEAAPYPRWTSLGVVTTPADWRNQIGHYFKAERLAFLDRPFDVLIAGCGTGVQALAAAAVYGNNARVTAIDISRASLAYAARMADRLAIKNIAFHRADILELSQTATFAHRFDVIESVGVLHHMADPYSGWRSLNACLAENGIMLLGLYSRTARQFLAALRAEPDYPGPNCSDDQLRQYRHSLLKRPGGKLDDKYLGIRDLYSMSGFRDLILHVSERDHTLAELATFMDAEGITFRGFQNVQDVRLLQPLFPGAKWPGDLGQWAQFEQRSQHQFADMYRFWCDRATS